MSLLTVTTNFWDVFCELKLNSCKIFDLFIFHGKLKKVQNTFAEFSHADNGLGCDLKWFCVISVFKNEFLAKVCSWGSFLQVKGEKLQSKIL